MLNVHVFEELSIKIKEALANSPVGDAEKNIRALLQGAFTKLELVSREEFDVQTELLRLTRQKLEALQARLDALEASQSKSESTQQQTSK